ncbi:10763_t:CDS:2 [Diversispora eburnea]|uniref:Small nuclear ribonucleoprotein E n=1 Tax=Diversispora eburnea TaxID=1213867 RepID=A0A9N9A6H9_9GLOM|nr:10763_t:CDS:2 [Diversispora eburnea]
MAAIMATKVQKIMNLIFKYLQNVSNNILLPHITIELFEFNQFYDLLENESTNLGFDEFMNLVLDNAEELNTKKKTRKTLGRILLKGDNITLIQSISG